MAFTVTTWNVENFSSDSPAFAAKRQHLAQVLASINPDVVALQEILDPLALERLAQDLGNYAFHAAPPDGRGNRVGFLFRSPPVDVLTVSAWRLAPNVVVQDLDAQGGSSVVPQFSRPALQATVNHNGRRITLLNAHLKSKLLTYRNANGHSRFQPRNETERANAAYFALQRRAAEARTLREHATDLLAAGQQVIALGDFNDVPDAATTQVLYGPEGSQPRGPQDVTNGASAFQRRDDNDAQRLFNVSMLAPAELRWSRINNGQKELIDHILASAGLMPVAGTLRRTPVIDIRNHDAPTAPEVPQMNGIEPDHAPVTAMFAV